MSKYTIELERLIMLALRCKELEQNRLLFYKRLMKTTERLSRANKELCEDIKKFSSGFC